MIKRTILVGFLIASLLLVGCGEQGSGSSAQGGSGSEKSCDIENPPLYKEGVLTVATDRPAYPPWFEGGRRTTRGSRGRLRTRLRSAWTTDRLVACDKRRRQAGALA